MKKLLLKIILSSLLLVFAGCSDDDTVPVKKHLTVEQSILGVWYPMGGTINGGEFINYEGDSCETKRNYQEFLADGTLRFVGHGENCEVNEINASAYTVSGMTFTVYSDIFPDNTYTIVSLTSDKLVTSFTYNAPEGQVTEVAHYSRN